MAENNENLPEKGTQNLALLFQQYKEIENLYRVIAQEIAKKLVGERIKETRVIDEELLLGLSIKGEGKIKIVSTPNKPWDIGELNNNLDKIGSEYGLQLEIEVDNLSDGIFYIKASLPKEGYDLGNEINYFSELLKRLLPQI